MSNDVAWLDVAGRVLIASSFLVAGLYNVAQAQDHVARMAGFHVPWPAFAFWVGMALLFAGSLLVLAGWHADIGALCLLLFTATATAIYHRFWTKPDAAQRAASRIALVGNVAASGGLLLLLQNAR